MIGHVQCDQCYIRRAPPSKHDHKATLQATTYNTSDIKQDTDEISCIKAGSGIACKSGKQFSGPGLKSAETFHTTEDQLLNTLSKLECHSRMVDQLAGGAKMYVLPCVRVTGACIV